MCNGASTRTTQGGSIAVLHPAPHLQLHRTPSSSSSASSTCSSSASNSSDDEDQQDSEEILLYFSNPLSRNAGTKIEMQGLNQRFGGDAGWVVIHRDGDLSSPLLPLHPTSHDLSSSSSAIATRNDAFCSFPIQAQSGGRWELERKLELGVGERGIVGRRVEIVSKARGEVLARGVIGWN